MTTASPDISRFGPIGLVVVQSTSLCNLDCSYCYLPDRKSRKIFDLALLPLLMQRIFESPFFGEELSLVWHAGEPLTLPCSYYDRATQLINEAVEKWTTIKNDFVNSLAIEGNSLFFLNTFGGHIGAKKLEDIKATTELSDEISKDLKKRGFKFVYNFFTYKKTPMRKKNYMGISHI